jgi:hypothetical protein
VKAETDPQPSGEEMGMLLGKTSKTALLPIQNPPRSHNFHNEKIMRFYLATREQILVGPAGFEPTTFTQEPRMAVPYGFL